MASNNIIFLEKWYEDLINDEFSPLSAEEVAYIMYAAAVYEWTGEKTNFAETFDRGDLNRVMAGFYPQIDSIRNYKVNMNVSPTIETLSIKPAMLRLWGRTLSTFLFLNLI